MKLEKKWNILRSIWLYNGIFGIKYVCEVSDLHKIRNWYSLRMLEIFCCNWNFREQLCLGYFQNIRISGEHCLNAAGLVKLENK